VHYAEPGSLHQSVNDALHLRAICPDLTLVDPLYTPAQLFGGSSATENAFSTATKRFDDQFALVCINQYYDTYSKAQLMQLPQELEAGNSIARKSGADDCHIRPVPLNRREHFAGTGCTPDYSDGTVAPESIRQKLAIHWTAICYQNGSRPTIF
jgi:hypothetical protein